MSPTAEKITLFVIATILGQPLFLTIGQLPLIGGIEWFYIYGGCFYAIKKEYGSIRSKANKHKDFGNARFAELTDIKERGLVSESGVVYGKFNNTLVAKSENLEGHSLIVGGTGTGKTRGVVIPTLLTWKGSIIAIDIKGELEKRTRAKRESMGQRVIVLNPDKENSSKYDPIGMCSTSALAQELARILIPKSDKGDPFWVESAQSLLSAYIYSGYLIGTTLTDIARTLCKTPVEDLVEYCRNHDDMKVQMLASIVYDMPEKTLGGVMSTLKSKLITLATDDGLDHVTSESTFKLTDLEQPTTIYIQIAEDKIDQYKDLLTIMISQTLKTFERRSEDATLPILVGIDEMPRLGKIEGLSNALATLRSKNIHILSIIQSLAQLDLVYSKDNRKIILDNCRFKYVLSATDVETQKYFSDLSGQKRVMSKSWNEGNGMLGSDGRSETSVPLIRPEDFAHLDQPVLLADKLRPTKLTMAWWDKNNF